MFFPFLFLVGLSLYAIYGFVTSLSDEKFMAVEPSKPSLNQDPGSPGVEHGTGLREGSAAFQIENIERTEIPELINQLPYNNWHHQAFVWDNDCWRFDFECNSVSGRFSATATGKTPAAAFAPAKQIILNQIRTWRQGRFDLSIENRPALWFEPIPENVAPRVLIIDDDVDLALAMQSALNQLGCKTEIATQYEDLHRKISFSDAEYIFLDWKLNNQVTADKVVERAMRLIDAFTDLRQKFHDHRPRVVTYSSVGREQIVLPSGSKEYFDHLDHWQKPIPFAEVIQRVSGLFEHH